MTSVLTPMEIGGMTKLYSKDRCSKYFSKNIVIFFGGGTGNPYFSTDTAAVLRAIEIEADSLLLAKAVDGVYDSDPKENPDAKKFDKLSIDEVVARQLKVVDGTASVMAQENHMPMIVFGLAEENSIIHAAHGETSGTVITA